MRAGFLTVYEGRPTYDYRVYCKGFCGPGAIAFVLGVDPEEAGRRMAWQHHHGMGGLNDIREDLQDSPPAHDDAVWSFGKQVKTVTCGELKAGTAAANGTIVLLHPVAAHPILAQHWVVYAGISPRGMVEVHWGDGRIIEVPDIDEWYSAGVPAYAYSPVVSGGRTRPGRLARLYVRIMRWFA